MHYTGVGSRETPESVMHLMAECARSLARAGYTLRSGGAEGADSAFESGAPEDLKEIYLPWRGFNGRTSSLHEVSAEALALAKNVHPEWSRLSDSAKKLHGRNMYQVLGSDLNTPSDLLLCWTSDGCELEKTRTFKTGGTASAIVLACRHNIPVFNLRNPKSIQALKEWMEQHYVVAPDFSAQISGWQAALF